MTNEFLPPDWQLRLDAAVLNFWATRAAQADTPNATTRNQGNRSAVTGGKQMDGFVDLAVRVIEHNGMPTPAIHSHRKQLALPGYFRPSKQWDLVVVHDGNFVAALEFKSQVGSLGNNFNNRTEEALGSATDIWTAFREAAFGARAYKPWLGWMMLLEDSEDAERPVTLDEPHFPVRDEFRNTGYAKRYELLARKLMLEKHYDAAALLLSSNVPGDATQVREPSPDLSMRRLLSGLGAHVRAYIATR